MLMPELIAIFIFTVAVAFGLIILGAVVKNKPTPKLTVFTHGFCALLALFILLVEVYNGNTDTLLVISTILFSVAALDGLTMFVIDMRRRPLPKTLVVVHPLLGITALIVLIIYVLF